MGRGVVQGCCYALPLVLLEKYKRALAAAVPVLFSYICYHVLLLHALCVYFEYSVAKPCHSGFSPICSSPTLASTFYVESQDIYLHERM